MLSDFTTCLQDFRRLEASDEFPVAGDEEAGAGGDFFAGCVGDHQQHDGGAGFFGEGFEINLIRLRADGEVGGAQRNRGQQTSQ